MKVGNIIRTASANCAEAMRGTRFIRDLADSTITRERYLGYVSAMYPVVTTFCGTLNRMIGLFDPVLTDPKVLNSLYRQGMEEIAHNGLWRSMLDLSGIDHHKLNATYRSYRASCGTEWSAYAKTYFNQLRTGADVTESYPEPVFPEPVLALTYWQEHTSSEGQNPWIHFACQSAIEATILEVVTSDVYPAVKSNELLNKGHEAAIRWWKEHSLEGESGSTKPSVEARHLELATRFLDSNVREDDVETLRSITTSMDTTLRLFAATMEWHNERTFSLKEYLHDPRVLQNA
jgi:hypothetical protein